MLSLMVKLKCYHCRSENPVRNGKTNDGKQRYLCHNCDKMSRDHPQPNGYPTDHREQILRTDEERLSLRGLPRIFGVMPELSKTLVLPAESPTPEFD